MAEAQVLAEVWRGDRVESRHRGHAVVVDDTGAIVEAWGDPDAVIYPRSSCKMIQALPLIETGAASAHDLGAEHLALACASHVGADAHVSRVKAWLAGLGLGEPDLRCGPQVPDDRDERHRLRAADQAPCQVHNNCSGKHSGFLSVARHLGAGPDYIDPDGAVQRAVLATFEEMTGETSPGFGIDGCSAPTFACTIGGLARAASRMAAPDALGPTRAAAARQIVGAMQAHPVLIEGEGRCSTALTAASGGRAAVKFGAEGVFVGILPQARLGIALKVEDGAPRAAEAAIAALLVRHGIFDEADPVARRWTRAEVPNRRGILTGHVVAGAGLLRPG